MSQGLLPFKKEYFLIWWFNYFLQTQSQNYPPLPRQFFKEVHARNDQDVGAIFRGFL